MSATPVTLTVLSEDRGPRGQEVVAHFAREVVRRIAPASDSRRIRHEPMPDGLVGTAVLANQWRSEEPRDNRIVVALRKYLATQLAQQASVVFFHFDADVVWGDYSRCVTRSQFARLIVEPVRLILIGKLGTSAAAGACMQRLVEVVPCYSIEAWTYQNQELLLELCRAHCRGRHAPLYNRWAANPAELDEVVRPKRLACVSNKRNLVLMETQFPWARLLSVGKSFAALVESVGAREEILAALATIES